MLIAAVTLLLSAASTAPADSTIIVTGRNISDKQATLAACLARRCPPNEDIDASLALAETYLIAGKYHDARVALLDALGRNKREALAYPLPLSDLYRANGRVAAHLGIDDDYYRSTWGIYNTLKKGMPSSKDLQYSAMMEVAEMMATTRGHDTAREYYRSIATHARADGRPDIAALAELRMIVRHYPEYAREHAIRKIAEDSDPKTRAAQLEARLALARMAYEKRDNAKGDAIVGQMAVYDIKKPILVYSPPWEVQGGFATQDSQAMMADHRDSISFNTPAAGSGGAENATGRGDPLVGVSPFGAHPFTSSRLAINVEDMWLDVGFRITPQGTVSDLQVLGSHGDLDWARPLLISIAGRHYTPATASGAAYRTERYTYTSGLEQGTASHGQQHSPNARVEYLDLSDISAPN